MKKDIDTIVNNTIATYKLSGIVLSDEDIDRIRYCVDAPDNVETVIAFLLDKHTKKE